MPGVGAPGVLPEVERGIGGPPPGTGPAVGLGVAGLPGGALPPGPGMPGGLPVGMPARPGGVLPPGGATIHGGKGAPLAGPSGMFPAAPYPGSPGGVSAPFQAYGGMPGSFQGPCGNMPAMYLPYYIMQPPTPMNTGSGPPFMPAGPAMPLGPVERENVKNQVKAQFEYYFGTENMLKDVWLRQRMNEEGWVPVSLVAGFKRVQSMTTDLGLIMEALSSSQYLELDAQGGNVRLRNNWKTWTLPKGGVTGVPGGTAEAALPSAEAPTPGASPSRS